MTIQRFKSHAADGDDLRQIGALLDLAFDGEFTDEDWEHSVGGWHVVCFEQGEPVSHASVVAREIEVDGTVFDAGYVEAVATAPGRQGNGFGSQVMRDIAEIIHAHHDLGALSTGEHHFYERLGWERWRGPSFVRHGEQLERTPEEDDGIMVLTTSRTAGIDLSAPIACETRSGDDW